MPFLSKARAQVRPPTPPPATTTFSFRPSFGRSPACVPASETTVTRRARRSSREDPSVWEIGRLCLFLLCLSFPKRESEYDTS